jgi:polyphosphate kinase
MKESPDPEAHAHAPLEGRDLGSPDNFINWQLSQLEFNWRVLAQTLDTRAPVLERLKFLCIFSTNLDEFYEIRVAGLKHQAASLPKELGPENMTPQEILAVISRRAHDLVAEHYRILNEVLFPELAGEGIHFISRSRWNERQRAWLHARFKEYMPIISPLGLDPAHPFPRILNKSLNFIVSLTGKDAFGRKGGMAIVQAPRILPRIIQLPPEETGGGPSDFVFLSSIIHAFVEELFPQMEVTGCHQFRVTRNSELYVDEEEIDDLRRAIEGTMLSRRYGEAVRLEVTDFCTPEMVSFLMAKFGLEPEELFQVAGPVNLNRLMRIYDLVDRQDLKYPPFVPGIPKHLGRPPKYKAGAAEPHAPLAPGPAAGGAPASVQSTPNLFAKIRDRDILLHHPFESFTPVVEFLQQAASDPHVLAIKQTLYRTGDNSAIVDALVAAAHAGKEVTVVVELRARFDEEANIQSAAMLEEAGAHLVFGVVGYKVHAKMVLVVRQEDQKLRHYVHLGTGNYHPSTARFYTDYGLFTCDQAIGEDVHRLFLEITGLGKPLALNKLIDSPFNMHKTMADKIHREAEHARAGKPARIMAKMNQLTEPEIIKSLYQASQAGVTIDLIVRGMCSLRPGIPQISENIRVHSIVDRFLEHTRAIYFHNDDSPEVFCTSADWMKRNLRRRVEVCFPIESAKLRQRVVEDLELYLQDNTNAWELLPDGAYKKMEPHRGPRLSAQMKLLANHAH